MIGAPQPMPHVLRLLADAAGVEAALKLALMRGGSRLTIPSRAEGSLLATMVGIDAASKITEALSGERLDVPHARKLLNAWLKEQGWSQERRATALRLGRRTIQRWDSGEIVSRQLDFFERPGVTTTP